MMESEFLFGSFTGGVSTSIIASYLYGTLNRLCPDPLKSIAPAAFRANPRILNNIERPLRDAREKILDQYRDYQTISTFLNERSVSKMQVLRPVFDHLFLGMELDTKKLLRALETCIEPGEEIVNGRLTSTNRAIRKSTSDGVRFRGEKTKKSKAGILVDDFFFELVSEFKRSLVAEGNSHKEAVLQLSISETQHAVNTIQYVSKNSLALLQNINEAKDEKTHSLLKQYHCYIKDNSEKLVVHGLKSAAGESQHVQHVLENAFVPLTMNPLQNRFSVSEEIKDAKHDWRGNATKILEKCQLVVLRGHAGCGKTTLMQWYIAHSGPTPTQRKNNNSLPVTPIYVPLRRLEAANDYDWSLSDLMKFSIPNETLRNAFDIDWIDSAVSLGYNLAFLLDGVDEIAEENRESFWNLTRSIRKKAPNARIVVTSRHLSDVHLASGSYRDVSAMNKSELIRSRAQWDIPVGFLEFVMSPLTDDEISSFIEKWYAAIDPKLLTNEIVSTVDDVASDLDFALNLEENIEAKELCRTPLLCGLLCLVFFIQDAKLPASRRQLYEIATKILIKLRDESRYVDEGLYKNIDLSSRLSLLRHIALAMQEGANLGRDTQTIEVDKDVVLNWVAGWLKKNQVQDIDASFLLRKLVDRSSIIREPTINKIDFVHRSFMEFLSANEIVLKRESHVIRRYIEYDQWWSTLQFCMDTETGGNLFAGELLEAIFKYVLDEKKESRTLLVRTAQLLAHASEIPQKFLGTLSLAFEKLAPPRNWDEVEAFVSFPFECFGGSLNYSLVADSSDVDHRVYCSALLAKHADFRTVETILDGYIQDDSREVIEWINRSRKVALSVQNALIARLNNGSYNRTVHIRLSDFGDPLVNKLKFRKLHVLCRGSIPTQFRFDCLGLVSRLYIDAMDEHHWGVLRSELSPKQTKNVRYLELGDCEEVNCAILCSLFPKVEHLRFNRCRKLDLNGLAGLPHLLELDIHRSGQKIDVKNEVLPNTLKKLRVSRQVKIDPNVITRPGLVCERLS